VSKNGRFELKKDICPVIFEKNDSKCNDIINSCCFFYLLIYRRLSKNTLITAYPDSGI
jgi:hypothetical protein